MQQRDPFSISWRHPWLAGCLAIGLALQISSCSTTPVRDVLGVDIVSSHPLPEVLAETSGLSCAGDQAYTINDSGNAPVLYRLSAAGQLAGQTTLPVANHDWEALAASGSAVFVADIGNNRGKRQTIRIHQLDATSLQLERQLALSYAGNTPADNQPYAHDFDAEALAYNDNQLILFSKSWHSGQARVYQIDVQKPATPLTPIAMINTLPGLITGADWDARNSRYVVVGYHTNAIGWFTPFIATVSATFAVTGVAELAGMAQVEAVCVNHTGDIWLTQERSPWQAARLVRLRLSGDRTGQ